MPKRVAIIDIGSNSARVVIYQRTSRFGFHLIAQKKANVRIAEGSFENDGVLQERAIQRAIEALKNFHATIREYKVRKIIVIATAAVRNAPNRSNFIQRVRKEVGLNIKVIDGHKEAYFGAVAAKNLLPLQHQSITVDIGGGSCDIALIENGNILETISLDIGTITLKELFFDKNRSIDEAKAYILKELEKIPKSFLNAKQIITIGGVLRALSKSLITLSNYSYNKIHAFEYTISNYYSHFEAIITAQDSETLAKLYIKANRYDTIRQGVLIFLMLSEYLNIQQVITSSVGVREGVFLHDMLRGVGGKFPKELNPSIISILDRLDLLKISKKRNLKILQELFRLFQQAYKLNENYLKLLKDAIQISDTGKTLTIYNEHKHTFYIAQEELNWQYTHKEMLLIAAIVRTNREKLLYKTFYKAHKQLLPSKNILELLSLIYNLSNTLASYASLENYSFKLENQRVTIQSRNELYLLKEELQTFALPKNLQLNYSIKE